MGNELWKRERFSSSENHFFEEALPLSWNHYLDLILPIEGQIRAALDKITDIKTAVMLQQSLQRLLNMSEQTSMKTLIQVLYAEDGQASNVSSLPPSDKKILRATLGQYEPEMSQLKREVDFFLGSVPHNDDKLLVIDLCRMAVDSEKFSEHLISLIGHQSLSAFRAHCQAAMTLQSILHSEIQELYHDIDFTDWRRSHFKTFLKEKRKEEKDKKLHTRPYTEYLDSLEKEKFTEFWNAHCWEFLEAFVLGSFSIKNSEEFNLQPYFAHLTELHKGAEIHDAQLKLLETTLTRLPAEQRLNYLKTMRSFSELNRPLLGHYRSIRNAKSQQLEKHLAAAFYPVSGFGYGRSQAFRQSSPQGSIFKIGHCL